MIDKSLGPTEKHFKKVVIDKYQDKSLMINESAFSNVTFDEFEETNVIYLHNNAFGKAASTIKNFTTNTLINTELPDYDVWKAIKSLVNLEYINVRMVIYKIPTEAFGSEKLREIKLSTFIGIHIYEQEITIKSKAFFNLNNLENLTLQLFSMTTTIEKEAFLFSKNSTQRLYMSLTGSQSLQFLAGSFDGIQRPVSISLIDMQVESLPEKAFKSVLDNKNNTIVFIASNYNYRASIDCTNCSNYWLIRDGKDNQISNAYCQNNMKTTLFSPEIKSKLKTNCITPGSSTTQSSNGFDNYIGNMLLICIVLITVWQF